MNATREAEGSRGSLFLAGWLVFSLLFVGLRFLESAAEGQVTPWSKIISDLFGWYLWALLFPLIWWVSQRFPFERPNWKRRLAIHMVLGILISALYHYLSLAKTELINNVSIALHQGKSFPAALMGGISLPILGELPQSLRYGLQLSLLIYFAIVSAILAFSYYKKFRDHELETSRLEAQLAQSQLEVLKNQLHPHFLFNTLNAISALMHRDVEAADSMIARLSDLLRLSLEKDERHLVPLQDELEFLDRYLAIEKIRFRDRLKVTTVVDPQCLHARVPKLILQPLVENSIRHGIAMRSAAGRVGIRASRRDEKLRLEISDDGPGLPHPGKDLHEGVGLANTRARLAQLFGKDHIFELRNGATGGFEAILEMPFESPGKLPFENTL